MLERTINTLGSLKVKVEFQEAVVQDLLRVPGTPCARLRSCQQGMVGSKFILKQYLW